MDIVKKAAFFAKKYHGPQMRQSGEPYYSHPVAVAQILSDYAIKYFRRYFTHEIIAGALLHDTIEDTTLTFEDIKHEFGETIAIHVEDLTRVKEYGKITAAESLEELYLQDKYGSLTIKLFDRVHNLQTIGAKSPEKVKKIIDETLGHFTTLAVYLEIPNAEQVLYQLCQNAINPGQLSLRSLVFRDERIFLPNIQNESVQNNIL
jgi:(p)ppGpp synthase/HD superfamily hydrolase